MTPQDKFINDPIFRLLVETMLRELRKSDFTPTELREAVILACTIHESEIVRVSQWNPAIIAAQRKISESE